MKKRRPVSLPDGGSLVPATAILLCCGSIFAQEATDVAELVEKEKIVESAPNPVEPFVPAPVGKKLQDLAFVRSRGKSRGLLRFPSERQVRFRENTQLRVFPSLADDDIFEIQKGEIYLHSRGDGAGATVRSGETQVKMTGTQFVVRVEEDGTIMVAMLEGRAEVTNSHGEEQMGPNDQVEVKPGQAPRKLARIDARNTVQWCLYYPAVLHLPDLSFSAAERKRLGASMKAYEGGDLLNALENWPANFKARSNAARVYRAMVVLAVGEVDDARVALRGVPERFPGRRAIEEMIDAVTYNPPGQEIGETARLARVDAVVHRIEREPGSASEWLARSYWEQSRVSPDSLSRALAAAEQARVAAPEFGYAAVRVAELQFSLGKNRVATRALEEGIRLTPRNAQGWALRGFVLSGENRVAEALRWFEGAIGIDSGLGNAWLGRGLCKIRLGQLEEGRRDLQTAMMLEPNRSLLHSYLGKASGQLGLREAARKDLEFAKQLDPNDPTPWLYSALLEQERNQPNTAIRELTESIRLNDNRALYRSGLLLDQDRAVRSANLAQLYQHNGMKEVAVREATRAVESDYTNASAHLFLANSFDALRDPARIELRYETPWFHELLMANLLSPVGGGRLSQFVSQHEYSKLFESDGLGGSFLNEIRSDAEWRSTSSVFGTYGRTEFGIDVHYREDSGDRINSEDRQFEVYGQLKHEVGPDDIVYLLGKWQDQESGDTRKLFDRSAADAGLQTEEHQEPGLLLAGWNHRWGPGSNTLFLGGRLSARQNISSPTSRQALLWRDEEGLVPGFVDYVGEEFRYTDPDLHAAQTMGNPPVGGQDGALHYSPEVLREIDPFLGEGGLLAPPFGESFDFFTQREFEIYSAEIQHIQTLDHSTILLGGRFQAGEIDSVAELNVIRKPRPGGGFERLLGGFATPAAEQRFTTEFERISLYLYDYWRVFRWLTLIGGVSWDRIERPENFRNPPLSERRVDEEQLSLKAGVTLTPWKWLNVRGMYAEALGGLSFDESVTLEPVQLAGFSQAYRTAISESLVGSVEAPEFTIWGLSVEGMLPTNTWWGVGFNSIEQEVNRSVGVFTGYGGGILFPSSPAFFADVESERLAYQEQSIEATVNQLIGDQLAVGALYRLSHSKLRDSFPEIPVTIHPGADVENEATLHELSLFANWNSPTGLFGRVEANWYSQELEDDPSGLGTPRDGDEFWQLNAFLGYRFSRSQGEISVGVLNLNDSDYRLSPLNPYGDLPRERTAVLRCRVSF